MVTTTSQHSTKPALRFCAGWNFCLWHVGDSWWRISLTLVSDEPMSIQDTYFKLTNLITRFDNLTIWRFDNLTIWRFEILSSELAVSKNCNCLLSERTIKLGINALNNSQYYLSESIEISPISVSISNKEPKDFFASICKALCLSVTGHEVIPNDLQACHCLKKRRLWL